MNVISLFDGASCGRLALIRAGVKVTRYYASEIDKHAIKIAQKNFPDTIHIGDVRGVRVSDLGCIPDIVIFGSPCQGFSFAGKQLNFNDPRSALFFEAVRILEEARAMNPDVLFFMENVEMQEEHVNVISQFLGVAPIWLNSNLFSAQNRGRIYWTNIPFDRKIQDRGILLSDILLENSIPVINNNVTLEYRPQKSQCLDANYHKGVDNHGQRTMLFEPYKLTVEKSKTILDNEVGRGRIHIQNGAYIIKGKRVVLEEIPEEPYVFAVITPDRSKKDNNGGRFNDSGKSYTMTAQDGGHGVLIDGYIRKLHPIECERLQTLPDNWTEGVSDTQRYKICGNGWTVDAIAHFFKGIGTGIRKPDYKKQNSVLDFIGFS